MLSCFVALSSLANPQSITIADEGARLVRAAGRGGSPSGLDDDRLRIALEDATPRKILAPSRSDHACHPPTWTASSLQGVQGGEMPSGADSVEDLSLDLFGSSHSSWAAQHSQQPLPKLPTSLEHLFFHSHTLFSHRTGPPSAPA